jgi:hypothetical protein
MEKLPWDSIMGMGGVFVVLMIIAIIWTLVWKAIALWKAARNDHKVWYIVMMIVNTLGILEIIYIFGFSRKK